jgi:4-diphosphocytidyl-2-C-methyl-D-erythritol kinase
MAVELESGCKVNLLLNILGKRPDGYHELETVLHPVALHDSLSFETAPAGVHLTCNRPDLPCDPTNLVHRAATTFLQAAKISGGVRIHLEKQIPLASGLGGGSGNAATTLLGLNRLFGHPVLPERLAELAATLGSDVPFFLQTQPALATGRGESITPLKPFAALKGKALLLLHPGFGISTAWAYGQLSRHPDAFHGRPGRAAGLIDQLNATDLTTAAGAFYNSLEAPALRKFPILALLQEFLRAEGAPVTLMSGSGSTTFAILPDNNLARSLETSVRERFGYATWSAVVPL